MNDDDNNDTEDLARKPRPVTDELRAQVAALHAEGLGRNEIARRVEVSGATVSKIAKQAGLDFERAATAMALRARMIDLATIREELARKFLLAADDSLEALNSPVVMGAFGGRDNVWNETLLEAPTIEQQSTLVRTAMGASKAGVELLKVDASMSAAGAVGILGAVRDALGVAVEALEQAGDDAPLDGEKPADDDEAMKERIRNLNSRQTESD